MLSDIRAVLSFLQPSTKTPLILRGFVPNMFWVTTSILYTHKKNAATHSGS